MSQSELPNQETKEKSQEELKELVAGWEQTLDAIESELEQKNDSETSED